MARPETFYGLEAHEREMPEVMSILDIDALINTSGALRDLDALLDTLRGAGLTVTKGDYGRGFTVRRDPTHDEMNRAVKDAQERWDRGLADYERITTEPGWWPEWGHALRFYCDREGIPMPAKPEIEIEVQA